MTKMTAPSAVIVQKRSPIRSAAAPADQSITLGSAALLPTALGLASLTLAASVPAALILAGTRPERLHVGRELPDRLAGQCVAEGRHAVRPALKDGRVDLRIGAAVDPILVRQRGAHPTPPGPAVAAGTVYVGDWFGTGPDCGLALMFTIAGILGVAATLRAWTSGSYRRLAPATVSAGPEPAAAAGPLAYCAA